MQLERDAFPLAVASVDDWLKEWPPQMGLKQWQNGKSAKELAKAWFKNSGSPAIPPGLERLLESHPFTQKLSIEAVIGESKIPLDAGRPRHADLILRARVAESPVLIHVEAKADEPFRVLDAKPLNYLLERRRETVTDALANEYREDSLQPLQRCHQRKLR